MVSIRSGAHCTRRIDMASWAISIPGGDLPSPRTLRSGDSASAQLFAALRRAACDRSCCHGIPAMRRNPGEPVSGERS